MVALAGSLIDPRRRLSSNIEAVADASYVALHRSGELRRRVERALELLGPEECRVCPRRCKVNRLADDRRGACRTGRRATVASYGPHFGEEYPLRGKRGSGTIFFGWCNMRCVFCQNWEISQAPSGPEVGPEELARIMLRLQAMGCHNINLVTPSHVVPQILEALEIAAASGLRIPLVYNTSSYDSLEALKLLEGVVDIYMPDIKWAREEAARRFSRVKGYPEVAREAIREMHRQVGDLVLDEEGIAVRGLLIRHLVMPDGVAGTEECLRFVAEEISLASYVNIMDQYRPAHLAREHPPLDRPTSTREWREAVATAFRLGLRRLDGVTEGIPPLRMRV